MHKWILSMALICSVTQAAFAGRESNGGNDTAIEFKDLAQEAITMAARNRSFAELLSVDLMAVLKMISKTQTRTVLILDALNFDVPVSDGNPDYRVFQMTAYLEPQMSDIFWSMTIASCPFWPANKYCSYLKSGPWFPEDVVPRIIEETSQKKVYEISPGNRIFPKFRIHVSKSSRVVLPQIPEVTETISTKRGGISVVSKRGALRPVFKIKL